MTFAYDKNVYFTDVYAQSKPLYVRIIIWVHHTRVWNFNQEDKLNDFVDQYTQLCFAYLNSFLDMIRD